MCSGEYNRPTHSHPILLSFPHISSRDALVIILYATGDIFLYATGVNILYATGDIILYATGVIKPTAISATTPHLSPPFSCAIGDVA